MIAFPSPPVCTTSWSEYSWSEYIRLHGVETEPEYINSSFGLWKKTGQTDNKGNALYSLVNPS